MFDYQRVSIDSLENWYFDLPNASWLLVRGIVTQLSIPWMGGTFSTGVSYGKLPWLNITFIQKHSNTTQWAIFWRYIRLYQYIPKNIGQTSIFLGASNVHYIPKKHGGLIYGRCLQQKSSLPAMAMAIRNYTEVSSSLPGCFSFPSLRHESWRREIFCGRNEGVGNRALWGHRWGR